MIIDYKKRYQTIKDKGAELSLNISSYIDKKIFLSFRNNYYSNFREIPLEDYQNIVASDKDIPLFPILSRTMEDIEAIPEGEEYHTLGYAITRYLREIEGYNWEDNDILKGKTKEEIKSRQYLPLELSFLFNTHNENTIEDTLTRYIKAVFNTPLDDASIKEEISHSFNKYALVFSLIYGGGYLLHPTYKKPSKEIIFKELLESVINEEKTSIKSLLNDISNQRERIFNSDEESIAHAPRPYNYNEEEKGITLSLNIFYGVVEHIKELAKEENTPEEAIILDNLIYNELIKQTPNDEGAIYPLTLTTSEDSYLRLLIIYLDIIISNKRIIKQKENYIQVLESILNDDELLEDYSYRYLFLISGEIKRVISKRSKSFPKPDEEINAHFISSSEPTLEIVKSFQVAINPVNRDEEISYIEQYRSDYRLKEKLEGEIKRIQDELLKEQEEGGYTTPKAKELQEEIRNLTTQIDNLNIEDRGKSEYAPFNYMILDNQYRRLDNLALRSYQVSSTQSVVIVNDRTSLKAPNNVIASYNPLTTSVLLFLIASMLYQNNRTITLTNEQVEKFILKDKYTTASLKDRDNARNVYFKNSLDLLVETTIITAYEPSPTASRKGIKRRAKTGGRGSLIRYRSFYTHYEIELDKEIYETAIDDFQRIPLPPRAYDLKPRAFITTYYISGLFAFNVREKNKEQRISFDKLIENNGAYAINLKSLKDHPNRLFTPILEDFEEMLEKDIISYYEPSLEEYKTYKMRLKTSDMITFIMTMKPQTKKKKK